MSIDDNSLNFILKLFYIFDDEFRGILFSICIFFIGGLFIFLEGSHEEEFGGGCIDGLWEGLVIDELLFILDLICLFSGVLLFLGLNGLCFMHDFDLWFEDHVLVHFLIMFDLFLYFFEECGEDDSICSGWID